MNWKKVGQKIKLSRHLNNMHQKELATALGVTISMISKYEAGCSSIPFEKLKTICRMLNLNIAEL